MMNATRDIRRRGCLTESLLDQETSCWVFSRRFGGQVVVNQRENNMDDEKSHFILNFET